MIPHLKMQLGAAPEQPLKGIVFCTVHVFLEGGLFGRIVKLLSFIRELVEGSVCFVIDLKFLKGRCGLCVPLKATV